MPRSEIDRILGTIRKRRRLSRREALQLAGGGLASWILSRPSAIARSHTSRPKVLIVGAGFAGLACAHELFASGCDVQIFEARNRVGGRVLTFKDLIDGKTVEAGGEFLGSNQPTVLAYAKKFGLEFLDVAENFATGQTVVEIDGRRLTAEQIASTRIEIDEACKLLNEDARAIVPDAPWKSPRAAELDARPTSEWIASLTISNLAKKLLAMQLTADNSVAVQHQSYLGLLTQIRGGGLERYWDETEAYRCRGGNQQFAIKLAEAIPPERMHLNCPVTRIDITDSRATLTLAKGEVWEADEIVLTAPPSTWKKIEFRPALPASLSPQMGTAVKHLVGVPGPFWQDRGLPPVVKSDGPISYVWWGTESQPANSKSKTLVSFTGGPQARTLAELPGADCETLYTGKLEAFFPGYQAQDKKTRFVNWMGDPWTLAGYSFPAPGQVTSQGPLLNKGLGRLKFAGEHVCYQFVGYMEGALLSGVSVAKQLLEMA